jgi:hypothetical protein
MVAAEGMGRRVFADGMAHIGRGFALFLDALRIVAGLEGWHSLLRLQQTWYNVTARCSTLYGYIAHCQVTGACCHFALTAVALNASQVIPCRDTAAIYLTQSRVVHR